MRWSSTAAPSSVSWPRLKKTDEASGTLASGKGNEATSAAHRLETAGFLTWDRPAQQRYEALRRSMLLSRGPQRTSPVPFFLPRFSSYGLLGLLDRDPLGTAWALGWWRPFGWT